MVENRANEMLKKGLINVLQETYSAELMESVLAVLQSPSPDCKRASVKFLNEMSEAVSVDELLDKVLEEGSVCTWRS
jgi:hypothetical protein